MFLRSGFPFNYDTDGDSESTGLACSDRSLAVQSARDEADINTIVKRFGVTGQLPQSVAVPSFIEFNEVFDYQSAMNLIIESDKAFMKMPAEVRARFGNNPHAFLEFVDDERNREEAEKLGIIVKEKPNATAEPILDPPGAQTSSST